MKRGLTDIINVFRGTTQVTKILRGTTLIWESVGAVICTIDITYPIEGQEVAAGADLDITVDAFCTIPTTTDTVDLIAWYKMDETAGITAVDSYASLDGVNTNISYNANGVLGGKYNFNGSSKVEITTLNNVFAAGLDWSVGCWVGVTVIGSNGNRFIQNRGAGATGVTPGLQVKLKTGASPWDNLIVEGTNGEWLSFANVTQTLPVDGSMHFIVVTWDSSTGTATFYIDGILMEAVTEPALIGISIVGNNVVFGQDNTGGQSHTGSMDETFLYQKELTQAQVTALYNEGNGVTL